MEPCSNACSLSAEVLGEQGLAAWLISGRADSQLRDSAGIAPASPIDPAGCGDPCPRYSVVNRKVRPVRRACYHPASRPVNPSIRSVQRDTMPSFPEEHSHAGRLPPSPPGPLSLWERGKKRDEFRGTPPETPLKGALPLCDPFCVLAQKRSRGQWDARWPARRAWPSALQLIGAVREQKRETRQRPSPLQSCLPNAWGKERVSFQGDAP